MDFPGPFGSSLPDWSDLPRLTQAQNQLLEQRPNPLITLTRTIDR
jgi:hypothetical protein